MEEYLNGDETTSILRQEIFAQKRWLAFIVTLLLFCLPVYAEEGTALSLDSSPASNGLARSPLC